MGAQGVALRASVCGGFGSESVQGCDRAAFRELSGVHRFRKILPERAWTAVADCEGEPKEFAELGFVSSLGARQKACGTLRSLTMRCPLRGN